MTVLSSKQILEDNETRDFNAITALVLTHKALSDVSCLSEFKNLERLDLSFNNLTSLEGLKSCVNLKWLSVVQNEVQSLKGIEGLTKLTGQTAYPYPDPYYRSIFAPYDAQPYPAPPPYTAQPMVHLQLMGIQQAGVPLPSDAVEEPVFVNAKQYHGILRRRQSRAKAESENKMIKSRKPYLHESRHLHALKRARGCGGRFLNSKKNKNQQKEAATGDKSQANINHLGADKNDLAPSENAS